MVSFFFSVSIFADSMQIYIKRVHIRTVPKNVNRVTVAIVGKFQTGDSENMRLWRYRQWH